MTGGIGDRLGPTRDAVLGLHRSLLAAERIAWEAMHGRIAGNAEFLQLAIHDPWFLWLRPMTALIAALDEAMIDHSPEGAARLPALLAAVRELLHPDDSGNDFQQRYHELVQRSPDVAVAHGVFMKELARALK
ncbi:MAG: hypothetical protein ACREK8_07910 [Gemmatimonadales bacterium]